MTIVVILSEAKNLKPLCNKDPSQTLRMTKRDRKNAPSIKIPRQESAGVKFFIGPTL